MLRTSQEVRREERRSLLATLRAVGPDAETLCDGWTAADVAAHLVVAERGRGVPLLPAYVLRRALPARSVPTAIRVLQPLADRAQAATKDRGWPWLLDRLAAGPPRPFLRGWVGAIRTVEEWLHHEDVRRANGLAPRPASLTDDVLWDAGTVVSGMRELLPGRESVELVWPGRGARRLGADPVVRVEGAPGELLLFITGRVEVADVRVSGDEEVVRRLRPHLAV